jgi:MraZ protein
MPKPVAKEGSARRAMNLFTGCYTHAIDTKNRVSVPRKVLETLRRLDSSGEVVITTGLDGCLFLYTAEGFGQLGNAVDASPLGESNTRDFARTFYSSAETCSIDRNGRLLLPESLKSTARLGDKVVFAGVGRRVELWNPETWEQRMGGARESYEQQAKEVFL